MLADFDTSRPCVTLCEICDEPSADGIYHADCLEEAIRDADDDFRSLSASLAGVPEATVRNDVSAVCSLSAVRDDESAPSHEEYRFWVRMLEGRYADTDRLAEVA